MKRVCFVIVAALSAVSAWAVEPSAYDTQLGTAEIGGGAGIVIFPSGLSRPLAYGRGGVALNDMLQVFGELGYVPIDKVSGSVYRQSVSVSSKVLNYTGGAQVQFPTGSRVTPYGLVGIGLMDVSANVRLGNIFSSSASESLLAYHVGGGVKVFLTPRFGLDFNARSIKPSGGNVGGAGSVGVFYQFNKFGKEI